MTFRLPSEVLIRRMNENIISCSGFITVCSRCAKKTVMRTTELIAAFFTVHDLLSFPSDVDRLLDPSGGSLVDFRWWTSGGSRNVKVKDYFWSKLMNFNFYKYIRSNESFRSDYSSAHVILLHPGRQRATQTAASIF